MKNLKFLKAIVVCTSFLLADRCFAINLNGTSWVGTFHCKGINASGNKTDFKIDNVTLNISQSGTDAIVEANFGEDNIPYDATIYNDAKKPDTSGALGMVYPGNGIDSSAFNELVWGKVSYNPQTGKGSFKGSGERVSANPDGFDTCQWTFKTR